MSSATELKNFRDQLKDYFDKLALNISSAANPLPSFEDYDELLTFDSIITDAIQGSDGAASYSVAALVDTTHLLAAIEREFIMRRNTKANYFEMAVEDSEKITGYVETLYGRYLNYFRGTSPEQQSE